MKITIKRSSIMLAAMTAVVHLLGYVGGKAGGQFDRRVGLVAAVLDKDLKPRGEGRYANVNGLKMYYEIHGSGQPLVLLHGAFGFNEGWVTLLPKLTATHQVIAVEMEGHGHTHDLDRPLTYQQMVEDTVTFLRQLNIKDADFFGYSMGGVTALGVAIRHPELVSQTGCPWRMCRTVERDLRA